MEQDVDEGYRTVCTTCLSSDRDLYSLSNLPQMNQVFRLLMYDFVGDRLVDIPDIEQLICWECLALMKRFLKFKWQVQNAQDHLRILGLSRSQESLDHTYMSQSLSSLEVQTKIEYDRIYFEFSMQPDCQQYVEINDVEVQDVKNEQYDVAQAIRSNINLNLQGDILEVPELVLGNTVGSVLPHILVGAEDLVSDAETFSTPQKQKMPMLTIGPLNSQSIESLIMCQKSNVDNIEELKLNYITEFMSDQEMQACREEAKQQIKYASSVYKCELCVIGFYNQQQVRDHFVAAHRARPGTEPCKICYVYVDDSKLGHHTRQHYFRYVCKLCGHKEQILKMMQHHIGGHAEKHHTDAVYKIGDVGKSSRRGRKKKAKDSENIPKAKPGDLRKLLSKTTIEGYQCLECEMFFKSSRARKTHVMRFHREGFQCDHCKKKFVNKTTLATHLRLHEGPLPREACPICHKMVRVIQLKYHIRRHQNKSRYECVECNKIFSHLATYQAHFKYSRAHESDQVFKFPCPMCNKGYPTKQAMQDHFNYNHLGKTSHKCPLCDKPIATRKNVERHMMRVHGEKKEKPRNHICQQCGKAFMDNKALIQHEAIHSCERPLSCEVCHQTFKQKASLYTHRKRVHKLFPSKRVVQFMDKPDAS